MLVLTEPQYVLRKFSVDQGSVSTKVQCMCQTISLTLIEYFNDDQVT